MLRRFRKWFRPLVVFYILVFYIFASFSWWAFLHVRKNRQVFDLKVQQLQHTKGLGQEELLSSPEYAYLQERYHGGNWMIGGEGIVFLLILALGIYRIHSGFQRELLLNRQQRNFLLSITHELKSPLAGIKLALETMNRKNLPEEKKKVLLDFSLKDADRLQNLVENILTAARLDNQSIHLSNIEVNAAEILRGICSEFENNFAQQRNFDFAIEENCQMLGDPVAIASIFNNLIENAIKYSAVGDHISVRLKRQGKVLLFEVADTGFGISDKNKRKIFDKFYRVGNEDTRKSQGTGLGLFIVDELTKWHNGTIKVSDNRPKGTIFTLKFHLEKNLSQQSMIAERAGTIKPQA